MKSVVLVCGHGPGISASVARKFGKAGHSVALVARTQAKLDAAAAALGKEGIDAKGFACDLGKPEAVKELVATVKKDLGPIAVIHWNAYQSIIGDILDIGADALRTMFDVQVTGLVTAVGAARADLEAAKGAVLVTGGGFCFYDPNIDAAATQWGAGGLAINKAAQHKTVGLLNASLKAKGVFVGEVVVTGSVKGTAFDNGTATLDPNLIADRFYELATKRTEVSVTFG